METSDSLLWLRSRTFTLELRTIKLRKASPFKVSMPFPERSKLVKQLGFSVKASKRAVRAPRVR